MSKGGIAVIVCIGLAVLLIGAWGFLIYGPNLRRLPYLRERFIAPSATSPQAAYDGFYDALAQEPWEAALEYISLESRERYRELLADPEKRQRQLADKAVLTELYTTDCDQAEACRREAIYMYEYEVATGFWEEVAGKRFFVPPGKQFLEMSFIELPGGKWQISEL